MLLLGILEGFAGYSLPDDLLSGTGLRIADGIVKATPVVGTYLSFFLFGGEFPGDAVIPRLYIVHVLLIPGLLVALVAVHLLLIVFHKHTQWPGPGRTEHNVVGFPFLPVYIAKATGFFFIVAGMTALMGGLLSINPLWKYGPYDPAKVTAGSQPDWYLGFAEGALRLMPGWESEVFGHTIVWSVFLPAQVLPAVFVVVFLGWPFFEARVTRASASITCCSAPATPRCARPSWPRASRSTACCGPPVPTTSSPRSSISASTRSPTPAGWASSCCRCIAFVVARRWCLSLQRADAQRARPRLRDGSHHRGPRGRLRRAPRAAVARPRPRHRDRGAVRGPGGRRRPPVPLAILEHGLAAL